MCESRTALAGADQSVEALLLRQRQRVGFSRLDGSNLLEDRQPFIEADEYVRALFKKRASARRDRPVFEMGADSALPGIVPVPKEEANAALEAHAWKHLSSAEIVVNRAHAVVGEHRLSELIQPLAASKPARGNDHGQIAWFERLSPARTNSW